MEETNRNETKTPGHSRLVRPIMGSSELIVPQANASAIVFDPGRSLILA